MCCGGVVAADPVQKAAVSVRMGSADHQTRRRQNHWRSSEPRVTRSPSQHYFGVKRSKFTTGLNFRNSEIPQLRHHTRVHLSMKSKVASMATMSSETTLSTSLGLLGAPIEDAYEGSYHAPHKRPFWWSPLRCPLWCPSKSHISWLCSRLPQNTICTRSRSHSAPIHPQESAAYFSVPPRCHRRKMWFHGLGADVPVS